MLKVLLFLLCVLVAGRTQACTICHQSSFLVPSRQRGPPSLGFAALTRMVEKRPILIFGIVATHRILSSNLKSEEGDDTGDDVSGRRRAETEETDTMSSAMVASIGFYKKFISPLLPPACRFVPTCSQYGVQAITEFGPSKGAILTAWRLLRCSPFGGKGYDPPKWPPVPYTYSSY